MFSSHNLPVFSLDQETYLEYFGTKVMMIGPIIYHLCKWKTEKQKKYIHEDEFQGGVFTQIQCFCTA